MKTIKQCSGRGSKHVRNRKAELAGQIDRLERKILKSVPYDNWSAGDGSSAPKAKHASD